MAGNDDPILSDFSNRLQLARMTAGIRTPIEMADSVGIERERYEGIEAGSTQPGIGELYAISRATGVSLDALILGDPSVGASDTHAQLAQIDFASIRAIREWIVTQGSAPGRLVRLESEAQNVRETTSGSLEDLAEMNRLRVRP